MTDVHSTTPDTTVPSAKAMGKRAATHTPPETGSAARTTDDASAAAPQPAVTTPAKVGMQTRKRVLPSRSRRGGPGVGNCDVDIMILETRRRRLESEPLIPPSTKFLLTTNAALVPSSSGSASGDIEVNTQAYGRYFDRPEVQKACREQELIQTPEYTQLSDDALVGGRFRPRNSDEELVDTSDAAYEKRHRKYESFEKRQRLREKEKLKHEQYKLKERIEQLRAMETTAFLALPASNFSEPPKVPHEEEHDDSDMGVGELPGSHVNGAAAYNEGERRRREMLEVAESLEERYRVLLPPDRKWLEKKERLEREKREKASATASVEPHPHEDAEDEEVEEEPPRASVSAPIPSRRHESDESEVELDARDHDRSRKLKLRIPPRPPSSAQAEPRRKWKKPHHNATISLPGENGKPVIRASDGRFLSKEKRMAAAAGESISVPPRKRPRTSHVDTDMTSPTKSVSSADGPYHRNRQPCVLMVSAMRNAAAQNVRKTHRHVTAFGVRVPQELEDVHDFEVPRWLNIRKIHGDISEDEYYDEDGDEHYSEGQGAASTDEMDWEEDRKEDVEDIEDED